MPQYDYDNALQSDDFIGRGSPAEANKVALADLDTGYRDAMKTAIADQGKGLQPDVLAMVRGPQGPGLESAFGEVAEQLKSLLADAGKDWTLSNPLSTGLVPYDLQAPSQKLFPVLTPLRNIIARKRGYGTSHLAKQVTGISGSDTGGVARVRPFHTQATQNTFGQVALQRPPKISYAAVDYTVKYRLQGLSDSVEWTAQWASQGFEDVRGLSNTVLLKAFMMAEEFAILGGRGTDAGMSAALGQPTITVTAATAASTFQGVTQTALADATYYVKVTPIGIFGEGARSAEVNVATTSQVVKVNITAASAGCLGYNVYAGTTTGDANLKFIGSTQATGTTAFVIHGGNWATTGALIPTTASDSSANDYDGLLSTLAIAGKAGYYKALNAKLDSTVSQIQAMFAGMWAANRGNPDELWVSGQDRADLSTLLLANGSSLPFRIILEQGDGVLGVAVKAIENQTTGKVVPITVHPSMPRGNIMALSYSLPFADSNVPNVFELRNVQDYFSVQWPQIQNTYDASIYCYGALAFYAPAFCGLLQNVIRQDQ